MTVSWNMRAWTLIVAGVIAGCGSSRAAGQSAKTGERGAPVVVELFTSQGCSSCPPADRLLSSMAADPELRGRVIPLAFHVDYWNDLGWADPFSLPAWSERQQRYAELLHGRGVFTPQLVVGGAAEAVGSDRSRAVRLIDDATPPSVPLTATVVEEGDQFRVAVTAEGLPPGADVMVALVQDGLMTDVRRGENKGRSLRSDAVVRRLDLAAGGVATLRLDPSWPRGDLSVVVFAQDRATWHILGAVRARPAAATASGG